MKQCFHKGEGWGFLESRKQCPGDFGGDDQQLLLNLFYFCHTTQHEILIPQPGLQPLAVKL